MANMTYRMREVDDLTDSEYALAAPKPYIVHVRRAKVGELIGGVQVTADGPPAFVVMDPYSLEQVLWYRDEIIAAFNILPAPEEPAPVPKEFEPRSPQPVD